VISDYGYNLTLYCHGASMATGHHL